MPPSSKRRTQAAATRSPQTFFSPTPAAHNASSSTASPSVYYTARNNSKSSPKNPKPMPLPQGTKGLKQVANVQAFVKPYQARAGPVAQANNAARKGGPVVRARKPAKYEEGVLMRNSNLMAKLAKQRKKIGQA